MKADGSVPMTGSLNMANNGLINLSYINGIDYDDFYNSFVTHREDGNIHRTIDDSGVAVTDLWSASKISSEIALASGGDFKSDGTVAMVGNIDLNTNGIINLTYINGVDYDIFYNSFVTHRNESSIHRTINDSGSSTTDLWSASKISSAIAGVAGGGDFQSDGSVFMEGPLNMGVNSIENIDYLSGEISFKPNDQDTSLLVKLSEVSIGSAGSLVNQLYPTFAFPGASPFADTSNPAVALSEGNKRARKTSAASYVYGITSETFLGNSETEMCFQVIAQGTSVVAGICTSLVNNGTSGVPQNGSLLMWDTDVRSFQVSNGAKDTSGAPIAPLFTPVGLGLETGGYYKIKLSGGIVSFYKSTINWDETLLMVRYALPTFMYPTALRFFCGDAQGNDSPLDFDVRIIPPPGGGGGGALQHTVDLVVNGSVDVTGGLVVDTRNVLQELDDITGELLTKTSDITGLSGLTTAEVNQLKNIDLETITNGQWGYVSNMDQHIGTTDDVQFENINVGSLNSLVSQNFDGGLINESTTVLNDTVTVNSDIIVNGVIQDTRIDSFKMRVAVGLDQTMTLVAGAAAQQFSSSNLSSGTLVITDTGAATNDFTILGNAFTTIISVAGFYKFDFSTCIEPAEDGMLYEIGFYLNGVASDFQTYGDKLRQRFHETTVFGLFYCVPSDNVSVKIGCTGVSGTVVIRKPKLMIQRMNYNRV